MTRRRLLSGAPVAAVTALAVPGTASGHPVRPETGRAGTRRIGVHLPADEAPHHDPTEWWYFSGHLTGVDGHGHHRRYGFEYVTFQFLAIAPAPVYIGNLAVTDLTRRSFHYALEEDSYPVPVTPGRFAVHSGPWSMTGRHGHDRLVAGLPGYHLDLTLTSHKRPVLHGRNGVIDFGPFGRSDYYSWTDLQARGTLVDHGAHIRVTGLAWMDHQWGAFDLTTGGGWDWFSIQLSDGQQYMLYFLRARDGAIVATAATRVGRGGAATHLPAAQVTEYAQGHWTSPATGITYPTGWTLHLPGGHLVITPVLRDQELDLRSGQGVAYWEGDVTVHGTLDRSPVHGVGYTEINPPNQP